MKRKAVTKSAAGMLKRKERMSRRGRRLCDIGIKTLTAGGKTRELCERKNKTGPPIIKF
jgi:hypothetical protein